MTLSEKASTAAAVEMAGGFEVVVEPMEGHSDTDIVKSLESAGASEIEIVAPGYISAFVNRRAVSLLETIAHIHPKQRHQLRGGVARSRY